MRFTISRSMPSDDLRKNMLSTAGKVASECRRLLRRRGRDGALRVLGWVARHEQDSRDERRTFLRLHGGRLLLLCGTDPDLIGAWRSSAIQTSLSCDHDRARCIARSRHRGEFLAPVAARIQVLHRNVRRVGIRLLLVDQITRVPKDECGNARHPRRRRKFPRGTAKGTTAITCVTSSVDQQAVHTQCGLVTGCRCLT